MSGILSLLRSLGENPTFLSNVIRIDTSPGLSSSIRKRAIKEAAISTKNLSALVSQWPAELHFLPHGSGRWLHISRWCGQACRYARFEFAISPLPWRGSRRLHSWNGRHPPTSIWRARSSRRASPAFQLRLLPRNECAINSCALCP